MEKFEELLKNLTNQNSFHMESHPNGVSVPVYWSEDNNGNVNFDVESMREEFEALLFALEEHNDSSEFDWDNC